MNVKAAGKEKRDEGADWAGRCGGKMMKGKPLCQEGVRGQGLPHCRGHRQVPAPEVTNALLSGQGSGSLSEAPLAPPVNTEYSHSCGLRDFTSRSVSCSYLGPGGLKPSFLAPFSETEMLEKILSVS